MSCSIVLMAITVTVNKYASSNVQAVMPFHTKPNKPNATSTCASTSTSTSSSSRRRTVGLLFSTVLAAQVTDSKTLLLNKFLKKSEENKAKNDKERLDSYYKRNYKDYFEFVEGSLDGKKELTESEKSILEWLQKNK